MDRIPSSYPHVEKFLSEYAPLIVSCCAGTPIFPSVAIAQAAIESDWGRTANKTLFGIKGVGPAGSVTTPTQEEVDGKKVTITDSFRAYNTSGDAVRDYIILITTYERYRRVRRAKTWARAAVEIQRAGYATDSQYAFTVIDVIDDFDLMFFDSGRMA